MELDKCSALLININRVICVFKIEFPRRAYFPFLRFMNNSWVQLYKATSFFLIKISLIFLLVTSELSDLNL